MSTPFLDMYEDAQAVAPTPYHLLPLYNRTMARDWARYLIDIKYGFGLIFSRKPDSDAKV